MQVIKFFTPEPKGGQRLSPTGEVLIEEVPSVFGAPIDA